MTARRHRSSLRTVEKPGVTRFALVAIALVSAFVGSSIERPARAEEVPTARHDPRPIAHIHVDHGFIDDPFALSSDGVRLAYITTDGATHAEMHVVTLGAAGEHQSKFPSVAPQWMAFVDAEHALVVDRDPQTGLFRGALYDELGPARDKLGPCTDIALATVDGAPAVVTYQKTPAKSGKGATHTFAAFRRDTLRPIKKTSLVENGEGRILVAGASLEPLYFLGGYSVLVAQEEGGYDKAHDVRKPRLEARLDVFAGKLVAEKEIDKVVSWAEQVEVRKKHPNERTFVRYSDDLQKLLFVDEDNAVVELATPRPLAKYDAPTLAYRPADPDGLTVSLTVDPVNAEAVKAQKADADWLDLYHLDPARHLLTELGHVDGHKRPTAWRLTGARLAVLRKHKGFDRGGADLDVYELDLPPSPEPPSGHTDAATHKPAVDDKSADRIAPQHSSERASTPSPAAKP